MPVYASASAASNGRSHPKALVLIVAAHALALAAVMTAKMEVVPTRRDPPIIQIPLPPDPPPPEQPQPRDPERPVDPPISNPTPLNPTPPLNPPIDLPPTPVFPPAGPFNPPAGDAGPAVPASGAGAVRVGPRFITPASAVEPPYPLAKRRAEEEATLRLRLLVDERGRVVAVEPVGSADPVFLEAARKHILARWRYKPATEDGRAVASATVITLRFELERF